MSDVEFNQANSNELSMRQGTVVFVVCYVAILAFFHACWKDQLGQPFFSVTPVENITTLLVAVIPGAMLLCGFTIELWVKATNRRKVGHA